MRGTGGKTLGERYIEIVRIVNQITNNFWVLWIARLCSLGTGELYRSVTRGQANQEAEKGAAASQASLPGRLCH
jgi:hypothetical protein